MSRWKASGPIYKSAVVFFVLSVGIAVLFTYTVGFSTGVGMGVLVVILGMTVSIVIIAVLATVKKTGHWRRNRHSRSRRAAERQLRKRGFNFAQARYVDDDVLAYNIAHNPVLREGWGFPKVLTFSVLLWLGIFLSKAFPVEENSVMFGLFVATPLAAPFFFVGLFLWVYGDHPILNNAHSGGKILDIPAPPAPPEPWEQGEDESFEDMMSRVTEKDRRKAEYEALKAEFEK